jgi:acyl-CoA reductase-like NAD-dependent aldehyde dehydrogenase
VACAHAVRLMLLASGLPPALLTVLDSSVAAGTAAIEAGVDKVCLTGSASTGTAVLHQLAETLTPAVMELSGCDAVFVLPGADLGRVTEAIAFGLRLNGSATCMAPRRLFVAASVAKELAARLLTPLDAIAPVPVPERVLAQLRSLVSEAEAGGARVLLDGLAASTAQRGAGARPPRAVGPTLLADVLPGMRIAQSDIFAPVLSVLPFQTLDEALAMHAQCPYMLTASIFGPDKGAHSDARTLAAQLTAGVIILNDVIVPTADPRVAFGGRGRSGFGVTRGAEGLLAMTTPRAVVRQRSRSRIAYSATGEAHVPLFAGYLQAAHGIGWRARLAGLRAMGRAMPGLRSEAKSSSHPNTRA